jgi:tRNA threonylcarbamoyl adenosine modification protein YeaZ
VLLAIDTSAGTSVAIIDRGILAQHDSEDTRRHAEVIGDLIAACLADAGVEVADLSGVVAGMGPGPFTGLRVGIAAARTFAWGARKPVIPLVSHDAIALGETGPVIVATDARRREVYWSAYSGADAAGLPVRVSGPSLVKAEQLVDVTDFARYRLVEASTVSAGALGMFAEKMQQAGRPFARDEPLYLRSPDVTISAGPKRVTA